MGKEISLRHATNRRDKPRPARRVSVNHKPPARAAERIVLGQHWSYNIVDDPQRVWSLFFPGMSLRLWQSRQSFISAFPIIYRQGSYSLQLFGQGGLTAQT